MATIKIKKQAAPAEAAPVTDNSFVLDGKKYRVIMQRVKLPLQGITTEMTAADIAATEEAQRYLVKEKAIGTVIEEVIE